MVASLKAEDLSVVEKLIEVGIDATLDDGIFKDVPIVGVIIGLGKTAHRISDVLFTRKLVAFLIHLKDVDAATRKRAIEKWEVDAGYRSRIGETLLNMIYRCDDSQKAKWLSQLFRECVLVR